MLRLNRIGTKYFRSKEYNIRQNLRRDYMSDQQKEASFPDNSRDRPFLPPDHFFDALNLAIQQSPVWGSPQWEILKNRLGRDPDFFEFINICIPEYYRNHPDVLSAADADIDAEESTATTDVTDTDQYREKRIINAIRQEIISDILYRTQEILNIWRTNFRFNLSIPTILLIGQNHTSAIDLEIAKREIALAGNEGIFILERGGDLHKDLDDSLILYLAQLNYEHVVTEDDLYVVKKGYLPVFDGRERSQMIGVYVANLIAENPNRQVTIIFGDEHINEIKRVIKECLSGLGYSNEQLEGLFREIRTQPIMVEPPSLPDIDEAKFYKGIEEMVDLYAADDLAKIQLTRAILSHEYINLIVEYLRFTKTIDSLIEDPTAGYLFALNTFGEQRMRLIAQFDFAIKMKFADGFDIQESTSGYDFPDGLAGELHNLLNHASDDLERKQHAHSSSHLGHEENEDSPDEKMHGKSALDLPEDKSTALDNKEYPSGQILIYADGNCLYATVFLGYLLPVIDDKLQFFQRLEILIGNIPDKEQFYQFIRANIHNLEALKNDYFMEKIILFRINMGLDDGRWGGPVEMQELSKKLSVNIQEISMPDNRYVPIDSKSSTVYSSTIYVFRTNATAAEFIKPEDDKQMVRGRMNSLSGTNLTGQHFRLIAPWLGEQIVAQYIETPSEPETTTIGSTIPLIDTNVTDETAEEEDSTPKISNSVTPFQAGEMDALNPIQSSPATIAPHSYLWADVQGAVHDPKSELLEKNTTEGNVKVLIDEDELCSFRKKAE